MYASLGYLAGDGPDQFTASSLHLTITLCVCDGACAFSMNAAKQELHRELANNRDAFLLVLANKCDLPNIMPRTWTPGSFMYLASRAAPCTDIAVRSVEEISQGLDLAGLGNPYILHECSATTGVGKSLALGIRQ